MEKTKMTKKDYFNTLKEIVADNTDLVAFIDRELELLDRKASSNKETKTQKENIEIKERLINVMVEFGRPVTCTELMEPMQLSNQKISALLKQLVECGRVVKVTDKKKSTFSVA